MEEFAVHDVSVQVILTAQNIKNLVKATESKDDKVKSRAFRTITAVSKHDKMNDIGVEMGRILGTVDADYRELFVELASFTAKEPAQILILTSQTWLYETVFMMLSGSVKQQIAASRALLMIQKYQTQGSSKSDLLLKNQQLLNMIMKLQLDSDDEELVEITGELLQNISKGGNNFSNVTIERLARQLHIKPDEAATALTNIVKNNETALKHMLKTDAIANAIQQLIRQPSTQLLELLWLGLSLAQQTLITNELVSTILGLIDEEPEMFYAYAEIFFLQKKFQQLVVENPVHIEKLKNMLYNNEILQFHLENVLKVTLPLIVYNQFTRAFLDRDTAPLLFAAVLDMYEGDKHVDLIEKYLNELASNRYGAQRMQMSQGVLQIVAGLN